MAFDLVTHVPYITLICILIIAVLTLSLYIVCSPKKKKTVAVQTYFTCIPKTLSPAEREGHGLVKVDFEKGERVYDQQPVRYSEEPTVYNEPNDVPSSLGHRGKEPASNAPSSLGHVGKEPASNAPSSLGHVGKEPAAEAQNTSSYRRPAPPIPEDEAGEHDYVNAHTWTNARVGASHTTYRMSQIEPMDKNRAFVDDDVISAAFTNDSFETYDDQYINTATMNEINKRV